MEKLTKESGKVSHRKWKSMLKELDWLYGSLLPPNDSTPFVMIMVPFIERIINLVIQNKPQTSIEEASLAEITTQI